MSNGNGITKADLESALTALGSNLRKDIGELRTEIYQMNNELRGEIHQMNNELRGEMHQTKDELKEFTPDRNESAH